MNFLSMSLSGIIAITNNSSKSESPWKIHLWIFTTVKICPSTVNPTTQFFIAHLIKFMICLILFIDCIIQLGLVWHQMWFYVLGLVTICGTIAWHGTKWSVNLGWHHGNNIAVTITIANTSAKCNNVVCENTCCMKCYIMIGLVLVTVSNATKCLGTV